MKKAAYALIGALAAIGALVVAMNFGWHLGAISVCGTPVETVASSPDGELVLVVGVSNCGKSDTETRARIVSSSGKTFVVFWGEAESNGAILHPEWLSPTKLKLSYSPSTKIRFPIGDLDGLHVFGNVEITYKRK